MADVAAFVLARLAEDEQAARAAYDEASDYRVVGSELAELHFVLHKPDRVLAEVAAKRALLAWLDELDEYMTERNLWDRPDTSMPRKIMAQPYADHPDYREEWSAEL